MNNSIEEAYQHVKNYQNWGIKKARLEREYRSLLRQESLKLKDGGMSNTLIELTVKGIDEVALKREERDVAETMVKVCEEMINISKLEARLIEAQTQREWNG